MQRPVPMTLKAHWEHLEKALSSHLTSDYWTSLLCNAYSTNQEFFSRPMGVLVEAIKGIHCASSHFAGGCTIAAFRNSRLNLRVTPGSGYCGRIPQLLTLSYLTSSRVQIGLSAPPLVLQAALGTPHQLSRCLWDSWTLSRCTRRCP